MLLYRTAKTLNRLGGCHRTFCWFWHALVHLRNNFSLPLFTHLLTHGVGGQTGKCLSTTKPGWINIRTSQQHHVFVNQQKITMNIISILTWYRKDTDVERMVYIWRHEPCIYVTCFFATVIYCKFSHDDAFCRFNRKNVIVMLELYLHTEWRVNVVTGLVRLPNMLACLILHSLHVNVFLYDLYNNNSNLSSLCLFRTIWLAEEKVGL